MPRFPQGADVRLGGIDPVTGLAAPIQTRDATNTLTNASATTVTLHNPAAAVTTYTSPTNDGTGLYHLDIPHADVSTVGHYQWSWDATIGSFHALTVGTFEVFDPFEVTVVPLGDAKAALNIPLSSTADDDELRRMISSVEANLERLTGGPIVNATVTERIDQDNSPWEFRLTRRPVVSVTSITDVTNNTALDVSALDVDPYGAIVRRKDGQQFFTNNGVATVVYTAGWGTGVPAAIAEAALIMVQHLWQTQRGPAGSPVFGGQQIVTTPVAEWPAEALTLLTGNTPPYLKSGGFM